MSDSRRSPPNTQPSRSCGDCFACCVWLGIAAPTYGINKRPGSYCKCLARPPIASDKHCAIYNDRPEACQTFKCSWLNGFGRDSDRPNISGVMVACYDMRPEKESPTMPIPDLADFAFTVTIVDEKLAGRINDPSSNVANIIADIFGKCDDMNMWVEVRVVNYTTRQVFRFWDGKIQGGVLLPVAHVEDMRFAIAGPVYSFITPRITDLEPANDKPI